MFLLYIGWIWLGINRLLYENLEEFSSGYLMKILDENEYENENWLGNLQENGNEFLENGQARSGS